MKKKMILTAIKFVEHFDHLTEPLLQKGEPHNFGEAGATT
jgi:hypothetical protein